MFQANHNDRRLDSEKDHYESQSTWIGLVYSVPEHGLRAPQSHNLQADIDGVRGIAYFVHWQRFFSRRKFPVCAVIGKLEASDTH